MRRWIVLRILAARLCNVPIALFVDAEQQWSRSNEGNLPPEIFCETVLYAHAILQSDVFAINDALADERFADKHAFAGESLGHYHTQLPPLNALNA